MSDLFDDWVEVYGVNENYDVQSNTDNTTFGLSVKSLKDDKDLDILLVFHKKQLFDLIDEIIFENHEEYLTYIVSKIKNEQKAV
jgi:hypothetical protein